MSQSTEVFIKLPELELTLSLPNGMIRRDMSLNEWEVLTTTGGKDILMFLVGNKEILHTAMGKSSYEYILQYVKSDVGYYADWAESMFSPSPLDEARFVISCFS